MKYNIVAIVIDEEELFRKTIALSASISAVKAQVKDLLDYGFNDICISREFYRSYTEPEIEISIYKTKSEAMTMNDYEIEAIIVNDAFRQTVHYRLPAKAVNEVVGNLFEIGARDIRIREVRERENDYSQGSTFANKSSVSR